MTIPSWLNAMLATRSVLAAILLSTAGAEAQSLVTIDTVLIGNPSNPAISNANSTGWSGYNGAGSVGYSYGMGTYEVTISQYTVFLNAAAKSDPYSLYNASMATDGNISGISRSGSSGSYSYSVIGDGDRPVTYVSWFDAARFSNWMDNGATASASTETGAYTLSGATTGQAPVRNSGADFWLPSTNEWIKAAVYNPNTQTYTAYANQSNTMTTNLPGTSGANFKDGDYATTQSPIFNAGTNYLTEVGSYSASFYGTFDQNGNVWEWTDRYYASTDYVDVAGGGWSSTSDDFWQRTGVNQTWRENATTGFRVASAVPEPTAGILSLLGLSVLIRRRRK